LKYGALQEAKEYASKFLTKDWKKFIDPSAELEGEADKDDWPWNEPGELPAAYLYVGTRRRRSPVWEADILYVAVTGARRYQMTGWWSPPRSGGW
jgi:hypothetical protein